MPDYGDLYSQFENKRKEYYANSPWTLAASQIAAATPDFTKGSIGQAAAAGAMQGIGLGLTTGLMEKEAQGKYANLLNRWRTMSPEERAADPELAPMQMITNAMRDQQAAEWQAKMAEWTMKPAIESQFKPVEIPEGDTTSYYSYDPITGERTRIGHKPTYKPTADTVVNLNQGPSLFKELVPAESRGQMSEVVGTMDMIENVAQQLDQMPNDAPGALGFALKRQFAITDEGKLNQQMTMITRLVTRMIEGARPTEYDAETYELVMKGDPAVRPKDIAKLFRQAKNIFGQKTLSQVEGYQAMAEGPEAFKAEIQRRIDPSWSNTKVTAPPSATAESFVTIRNKRTGEIRQVTRAEAEELSR